LLFKQVSLKRFSAVWYSN